MSSDPFQNAQANFYRVANLIELEDKYRNILEEPQKLITVKLPILMDDGSTRVFTGYRSQHNNTLGNFKGGIRYHQDVSESEVKALSMWMSWKTAAANLPLGGGKGGIVVNPKELSTKEIERLSRAYSRAIAKDIGPEVDVPAPDVNTNGEIMGWILDEYRKVTGDTSPQSKALITGKTIEDGGSLGRTEATGYGGVFSMVKYLELAAWEKSPSETTIAIQGIGNVGYYFAEKARELGYKIVAFSDSKGAIYSESGLNEAKVMEYKQENGTVVGFDGSAEITNAELLELDVDILVPSALENVITEQNAKNIKARHIIEMANGPITNKGEEILLERGIQILPDIIANAGGVTVSYYEWQQNMADESWEKPKVLEMLEKNIKEATEQTVATAKDLDTDYRMGAYANAVRRIVERIG